ncbi:7011_t:CDS:1, partial [Scutellospora calospora]
MDKILNIKELNTNILKFVNEIDDIKTFSLLNRMSRLNSKQILYDCEKILKLLFSVDKMDEILEIKREHFYNS